MRFRSFLALGLAALLVGCSGMRLVDNQVQSFSSLGLTAWPGVYQFERLPSQQAQPQAQTALEAMARIALAGVGLQPGPQQPGLVVQVSASTQRDDTGSPFYDPYAHHGFWGHGVFGISSGQGLQASLLLPLSPPHYRRRVALLMRDARTGTLVYESSAVHEGPWGDSAAIYPAMLSAALQGFPHPPTGPRLVPIEIPR